MSSNNQVEYKAPDLSQIRQGVIWLVRDGFGHVKTTNEHFFPRGYLKFPIIENWEGAKNEGDAVFYWDDSGRGKVQVSDYPSKGASVDAKFSWGLDVDGGAWESSAETDLIVAQINELHRQAAKRLDISEPDSVEPSSVKDVWEVIIRGYCTSDRRPQTLKTSELPARLKRLQLDTQKLKNPQTEAPDLSAMLRDRGALTLTELKWSGRTLWDLMQDKEFMTFYNAECKKSDEQ